MIRRSLFLVFMLVLGSCKETTAGKPVTESEALPKNKVTETRIIEEVYAFAIANTLEDHFPDAVIEETKKWIEEGTVEVETLKLHPNTPKELLINYSDLKKSDILSVEVYAFDSPWKSSTGIYMGMPIDELETLNKKPLSFYGYQWDNAGAVDFENGALSNTKLFAYLGADAVVEMPDAFIGSDKKITSKQAEESKINFKVTGLLYRPQ